MNRFFDGEPTWVGVILFTLFWLNILGCIANIAAVFFGGWNIFNPLVGVFNAYIAFRLWRSVDA